MLAVLVQAATAVAARPPPTLGPGAGAWVLEDPEPFGVSTEELDLVAKRAALAMPVRYCMLMAVDGHLIHETYFHNSSEATYEADSLAKTMTAQVVGVAVSKGLIDLDKPIVEYGVKPRCAGGAGYSPPPVNATCAALLRTLCPHVAPPYDCNGWSDVYPPLNKSFACSAGCLQNKNVTNALRKAGCSYRDGQDWCRKIPGDDGCWRDCRTGKSFFETLTTRHLLAQTSGVGVAPPGTHWTYDSDQYIDHLAYIVSKVTNESSASWATREYLIPMGLPPDLFAYDGFVDPVDGPEFSPGGGQMMSCRDHLRVAQLLINKGKWPVGGDGAGNGNTRNSVNNAANASSSSSSDDDGDVNAGHTLETTMYYLNKTVVTNKTVLGTCLPCCKEPQPGTQVCCCPPPGCAIPPSCPPPPTPPPAPPSPPPPSPGPVPPSPRQYTQLLSEAYVKEFLTPSFPNQVSTAYGFLMWLNQPANDLHCCAARWGSFSVVEPPACFASKSKFGSTCRVQTCAGHHIDNHLVNDGLTMMQAPNDLALGMGQSSKYIMTIPSEGLAVVTLGLSWPSSSKCPQGLVNVGGEALMNGTILPAGARAIASGYDDSFGSTQIWRSFGNKMRQLAAARQAAGVTSDTPIPLIEEVKDDAEADQNAARRANEARSIAVPAAAATTTAVPAPGPLPFRSKHRSAQLQYYKQLQQPSINIHSRTSAGSAFSSSSSGGSSGGVTGGRGGGRASGGGGGGDGNTASTGGACYCTCPPMMGFGICANMPAGTADGDCSSILGTAADVCPSHGAPRQCHSPEIPEDTDCSNVLSNDRSSMACTLLTGCRNLPGAGENGFPPPEANFTFSSCLCKPQAFEAKSCHWTSDPCIYSPFFPT